MIKAKKTLKKILNWATFLAVPLLFYIDAAKETLYLNKKLEETCAAAMIDLIRANNYLKACDYKNAELYGLRAKTKFSDWEDIPCDYFFNKEILKFLNAKVIDDFKSRGLGIYYNSIDERARRKNNFI